MASIHEIRVTKDVEPVGNFDVDFIGVVGLIVTNLKESSSTQCYEVPFRTLSKSEAEAVAATVPVPFDVALFGGRYCRPTEMTRALLRAVLAGDTDRAEALASSLPHLFSNFDNPDPRFILVRFDEDGNLIDGGPLVYLREIKNYAEARFQFNLAAASVLNEPVHSA